jgi:FkbM family methyltransferase
MWSSAKSAVADLADRFGYAMLPKWRLPNLEMALHLRQLFAAYDIGCVIDVGANAGQYGRFLRQEVGFKGLILSIEPAPACFAELAQAAAGDSDWLVYNFALGSTEGNAELKIMAYSQLSSFLEPNNDQPSHMAALNRVCQRVVVPVRRLDAVIAQLEPRRLVGPIYLKLDTQGFDLEVVKGTGSQIERVRALQTELSVLPIYDRMTDWRVALAELAKIGFELSGFWAVNRDAALRAIEFDCVMVRTTCCSPAATPHPQGEGSDNAAH